MLAPKDADALRELAGLYLAQATAKQRQAQILQSAGCSTRAPEAELPGALVSGTGQSILDDKIGATIDAQSAAAIQKLVSEAQSASARRSTAYKQIAELQPNDPNVQLELAQAAEQAGDTATAIAAYTKFLKLAPDDPSAPIVKQQLKQLRQTATRRDRLAHHGFRPHPSRATRSRRLPAVLVAVVAAALLAAGCGSVGYSEGTGDRTKGKELFVQKCGSCHTLADAGTTGQIGPNLDYAFLESRRNGLGESTIVQVVRGQIAYPIENTSTGAPGMPANLVEGQDADDVASYVASVAGVGNPNAATPAPSTTPLRPRRPRRPRLRRAPREMQPPARRCSRPPAARLPHARRRGRDRHRRPEPRRGQAERRPREERVTNGKGVMPPFKGQLDETQIADVAAYVSSVAGK